MTAGEPLAVLLVEDSDDDARYIERLVLEHRRDRHERSDIAAEISRLDRVERLGDALEVLTDDGIDVVLLDLQLPDSRGLDTVSAVTAHAPGVPIIVLTGRDGGDIGARAIQRGAQDYLEKAHLSAALIHRAIRYGLERKHQQRTLSETNHRLAVLSRLLRTDIRNELSVALGWADVLEPQVTPDGTAAFESMRGATQNVVECVDMAADVATALETDVEATTASLDLEAVLETELEQARHRLPAVDIEYRPASADRRPVPVLGTPLLSTAIAQLLSALARHADGPQPTITVALESDDDRVIVSIGGEAIRLPRTQRAFLAASERRIDEGPDVNVGLYLVQTVIDQAGGEISIADDTPGTTVSIHLKRAPTDDPSGVAER
ncbi:ATP-binding response regulator [Natronorubrum thiooxidans]|uniref:Histidine kinase-, DNA gyrase B-, and HSP90-like ATPase n=1 Tax=Natronorubrum thiooxidans TaxID=308853 RepID=A0A1N7G7E5_9EURY|nr:response regulator [Natronorubrum thiooxidans]SIS08492.1 Histidine kinase-, DNA gyrase B-, and HSP90-like ATPase [Natronorubrum thiooxidans]